MALWMCLLAYGIGSIPFGVIIGKLKGVDLRRQGSGNIGAANAFRALGKGPGALVLLGDVLKGVAALWIAKQILGAQASPPVLAGVGFCAILGHNYSCFLRLRGGKGVATTLGVFLFLSWKATLAAFSFWVVVVALTRYASAASMAASFLLPVFLIGFKKPRVYVIFAAVLFLVTLYKHRANIKRLMAGQENKLI